MYTVTPVYIGSRESVTSVTLKLRKHFLKQRAHTTPLYTTIYNNNNKLYIFNVTNVTALVYLATIDFLRLHYNVT